MFFGLLILSMTAYVATTANVSTHAFVCVSTAITAAIAIVIGGGSDQPLSPEKRGVGECDAPLLGDYIATFAMVHHSTSALKPTSIPPCALN